MPVEMMKAVRIHEYGGSSVLKYEDAEVPDIANDEMLIKAEYASVNPVDWKIREGYMKERLHLKMPSVLGIDLAGRVARIGSEVTGFSLGERVACRADADRGGSYAEYVAVKYGKVAKVPEGVRLADAAALPVACGTAWSALFESAELREGERVLIIGASGGVGTFAVQLAKNAGAYVAATTSSRNVDLVKSLGADQVIDYTSEDVGKSAREMDIVLDTVGGTALSAAFSTLRSGGRLVSIAANPDAKMAEERGIIIKPVNVNTDGKRLAELLAKVASGELRVVTERQFSLSEVAAAHELSQSGKVRGKIIIKIH